MAVPVLNAADQQAVKMLLSSFNQGVTDGVITNTTVSGANTYAVFLSRVQANVASGQTTDNQQNENMIVLRSLPFANALGILTDTNLNGLTTVAAVQALYTGSAPGAGLPLTYTGCNIS